MATKTGSFSQTQTMHGRSNHAATHGACHNFSIQWLSEMFANADPAKGAARMSHLASRKGGANPVLQKAFGERWAEGGSAYKLADRMMLSLRGLREVNMPIAYSVFNQASLVSIVNAPRESGMVYSFWFNGSVVGAAGGAHTIAFFRSLKPSRGRYVPTTDSVFVFDPNFGEYHVPTAQFGSWFSTLTSLYGPMSKHMMKFVRK